MSAEEPKSIKSLKETLADMFDLNAPPGHCIGCKEPFSEQNVYSSAGWRETLISGMCERCYDRMAEACDQNE